MSSFQLEPLLPKHIKKLLSIRRKERECPENKDCIRLHKNENRLGSIGIDVDLSQYPDPQAKALRKAVATWKNISEENICLAAGVEELSDLIFRSFCHVGKDQIFALTPSEALIHHQALSLGLTLVEIPLNKYFQLVTPSLNLEEYVGPKVLYLSSPNGISGQSLRIFDLIDLIDHFPGIVVVNESYIDYSSTPSLVEHIKDYPNLIVLQSFSKAWGLAGIRAAIAYANPQIIEVLYAVKAPHSLSSPAQDYALKALRFPERLEKNTQIIIQERENLKRFLGQLSFVVEVLDSDSNFLLVRFENAQLTQEYLFSEGFIVADMGEHIHCENTLRIGIGTAEENLKLMQCLQEMPNKTSFSRRFLKSVKRNILKAGSFIGFFKKIFS